MGLAFDRHRGKSPLKKNFASHPWRRGGVKKPVIQWIVSFDHLAIPPLSLELIIIRQNEWRHARLWNRNNLTSKCVRINNACVYRTEQNSARGKPVQEPYGVRRGLWYSGATSTYTENTLGCYIREHVGLTTRERHSNLMCKRNISARPRFKHIVLLLRRVLLFQLQKKKPRGFTLWRQRQQWYFGNHTYAQ